MLKLKSLVISFVVILVLALVACDASSSMTTSLAPASPTPNDMLAQMFEAQDRATNAAATSQRIASQATTIAQVTREYVILQGQQTRVAQDSRATQTVFAQNVSATEGVRLANQTRYADESRATSTMFAINATATVQAAQFTATAYMQSANATATAQAVVVEATRTSASATATANAVIVEATRASASATATAHAASASQTQVAALAIQTRTSEETQTMAAKQNWERTTESVRAVGSVVGVVLLIVGGLCVVGFLAWRFADATILRIRVIRDANGVPFVITEADRHGRREMLAPTRAPGAVTLLTPPQAQPLQIEARATDANVTRRDQAIGLMLAAGPERVNAIAGALEDDETEPTTGAPELLGAPRITIFKPFEARTLELADAPRLSLPMGTTANGEPLWIPFQEVHHALIGGPSGMGKTNLVHGWIQALQHAGVELLLHDGKAGLEFGRYAHTPHTRVLNDDELLPVLGEALGEMKQRFDRLAEDGTTNIVDYNRTRDTDDRMPHQAIVIDELYDALRDDAVLGVLETLASKARAIGIHLIMATQLPDAGSVPKHLRINALLRVAFACPSHTNSNAILGYSGAEKIEKTPGRLLVFWHGKLIEAQAFKTVLPPGLPGASMKLLGESPSPFDEETRRMVAWAIQQGGGRFVATRVAVALGIRMGRVVRTAQTLERQGLLSPVQKNESGQNLGRQISQKLTQLISA